MRIRASVVAAVLAAAPAAVGASAAPTALTCPARHGQPGVSRRAGADAALVPDAPRQAWLCRYDRQGRLVADRLLAPAATARLARDLNAVPPPNGAAYSCPAAFRDAIVARFLYPSGPADPVDLGLSGCNAITNGHVERLGLDGAVVREARALVPLSPRATIRGHVEFCGGPAGASSNPCRIAAPTICSPDCATADRVAFVDASGRTLRTVHLKRARFSQKLPGGLYTLRLLGDGRKAHGWVMQTQRVSATAGRTSHVVFTFIVP